MLMVVCPVPSFQSTSTAHGPPSGSLNEPRSKVCGAPSTELWSAGGVRFGAMLNGTGAEGIPLAVTMADLKSEMVLPLGSVNCTVVAEVVCTPVLFQLVV